MEESVYSHAWTLTGPPGYGEERRIFCKSVFVSLCNGLRAPPALS
jgi:hypothetical protein